MNQLEKLILPTKTTKMCLWTLQQDDAFFERSKSPMFSLLSQELQITEEQAERIHDRRAKIVELLTQLKESLRLIQSLRGAIDKKHSSYDSLLRRIQESTSPKQTVLFLLWITRNATALSRFIPQFSRSIHHTPNVEFVKEEK